MSADHRNSPELEMLLQAVFGARDEMAACPNQYSDDSHQYLAFPSSRNARVLLPRWHAKGAAGYLVAGIGLRDRRQAALRQVASRFVRSGGLRLSTPGMHVDPAMAGDSAAAFQHAVAEHMRHRVGSVAFSVRRWSPNWKPTFTVMAEDGVVIGYGKVGWDGSSINRIGAEVEALTSLAQRSVPGMRTPRLLAHFEWNGRAVLVVSPIPESAVRHPRAATAPSAFALEELERGSAESAPAGVLLVGALAAIGRTSSGHVLVSDVQDMIKADREVRLTLGRAHGDWVPWNVATDGADLWAWDWEHSSKTTPVGLDIVHWHTLIGLHVKGQSPVGAFLSGRRASVQQLRHLGFAADQAEWIATLGLLRLVHMRREFLGPLTESVESVRRLIFTAIG